MSKRIAVVGFQHETNSFAQLLADCDDVLRARVWPGLARGQDATVSTTSMSMTPVGLIPCRAGRSDCRLSADRGGR